MHPPPPTPPPKKKTCDANMIFKRNPIKKAKGSPISPYIIHRFTIQRGTIHA